MKRIITLLILLTHLHIISDPATGLLTQDRSGLSGTGITERYTTRFYNDIENYVNGGLTFTYPTDYWTFNKFNPTPTTPRILISIQLNGDPSATTTYAAVVSANSPTSTTVIVYRISNGGTVVEASTDEVGVVLFGIQEIGATI
jgi:hypothetical protein